MKNFLLIICLFISYAGWNQSFVYAVDPYSPDLHEYDTTALTSTSITLTSTLGTITGSNGLASDPCGANYIVYQVSGTRRLGTVVLSTGVVTDIGLLSDNIASIAYDYVTGTLYGVTGDGANTPETLYEISTSTAVMTFLATLGNGNDGEAITYNPTDGLLYHWSGWGMGSVIMETIDPVTFAITPIILSGDAIFNVGAAVYTGGEFLVSDVNAGTAHLVTIAGVVTNTLVNIAAIKGLSFGGMPTTTVNLTAVPGTAICAGDSVTVISTINNNVTYQWSNTSGPMANTTPTLTTDIADWYYLEVTDGCSVVTIDSVELVAAPTPIVNIIPGGALDYCEGDSVEIAVNFGGGANIQWYLDGVAIANATAGSYFVSTPGSYNVTKTNMSGCTDSAATAAIVTENALPVVTITPGPVVSFCESVDLSVSPTDGTVQWFENGAPIAGQTGVTLTVSTEGVFNAIVTDGNGCLDSAAIGTITSDTCVLNLIKPDQALEFSLYPNPASEFVTIDISAELLNEVQLISIIGIDGRIIVEYNRSALIDQNMQIDLSDLNQGIYVVSLQTVESGMLMPLIIE